MCDPMVFMGASLLLGAAQAVSSSATASAQASAQAEYQNAQAAAQAEANRINQEQAINEYIEQSAAERMAQMQTQDSIANEKQQLQREALQKQGAAVASSNAAGGIMDVLLADYARQYGVESDLLTQQYEMAGVGADTNVRAYRDKAINRIDSQQNYLAAPISSGFSPFTAALGIAGSATGLLGQAYKDGMFDNGSANLSKANVGYFNNPTSYNLKTKTQVR